VVGRAEWFGPGRLARWECSTADLNAFERSGQCAAVHSASGGSSRPTRPSPAHSEAKGVATSTCVIRCPHSIGIQASSQEPVGHRWRTPRRAYPDRSPRIGGGWPAVPSAPTSPVAFNQANRISALRPSTPASRYFVMAMSSFEGWVAQLG